MTFELKIQAKKGTQHIIILTYSFRRKQDFWGAIQQKSLSLVEKIRVLTKSCKNPRLFDLFSGLTIGLLELFLDHQKQNFKQNSKVPKSAYTKNAQKTVPLTERLCCSVRLGTLSYALIRFLKHPVCLYGLLRKTQVHFKAKKL